MICRSVYALAVLILSFAVLSCKGRVARPVSADLQGTVIEESNPPQAMYHFGRKSLLLKNDDKNWFSPDVWDAMRAPHNSFRKGLYVAQHPAYNERYTQKLFGGDAQGGPWLMKVSLQPQCLATGQFLPYLPELVNNWKMIRWFDSLRDKIKADKSFADKIGFPKDAYLDAQLFRSYCLINSKNQMPLDLARDWEIIERIFPGGKEKPETACSKTLGFYLDHPDLEHPKDTVGIARDSLWPYRGFWYVRNQGCIQSMQSDAASVLKIFAEVPQLWHSDPFTNQAARALSDDSYAAGRLLYVILLGAMVDVKFAIAEEDLKRIEVVARDSRVVWSSRHVYYFVRSAVDAVRRCRDKGGFAPLKEMFTTFHQTLDDSATDKPRFLATFDNMYNELKKVCGERKAIFAKPGRYKALGQGYDATVEMAEHFLTYEGEKNEKISVRYDTLRKDSTERKFTCTAGAGTDLHFCKNEEGDRALYMGYDDIYFYWFEGKQIPFTWIGNT